MLHQTDKSIPILSISQWDEFGKKLLTPKDPHRPLSQFPY